MMIIILWIDDRDNDDDHNLIVTAVIMFSRCHELINANFIFLKSIHDTTQSAADDQNIMFTGCQNYDDNNNILDFMDIFRYKLYMLLIWGGGKTFWQGLCTK